MSWRTAVRALLITLATLCALVAAFVAFLMWREATKTAPQRLADSAWIQAAATAALAGAPVRAGGASAAGSNGPSRPASSASEPLSDRVWDLCGLGRVPYPVGTEAASQHPQPPLSLVADPLVQALEGTFNALSAGGSRPKMAALMLGAMAADRDDAESTRIAAEIVAEADRSPDPVVALWALHMCGDERCRANARRRWVERDPENAAAWMSTLQDRPPPERAELLRKIAAQPAWRIYPWTLAATIDAAVPPEAAPWAREMLLVLATGIEAAIAWPLPMDPASSSCTDGGPHDTCDAMAHLFVDRSDALLAMLAGMRLAERAGWPASLVHDRRAEVLSLYEFQSRFLASKQPYACDAIERRRTWRDLSTKLGEAGAARQLMATR